MGIVDWWATAKVEVSDVIAGAAFVMSGFALWFSYFTGRHDREIARRRLEKDDAERERLSHADLQVRSEIAWGTKYLRIENIGPGDASEVNISFDPDDEEMQVAFESSESLLPVDLKAGKTYSLVTPGTEFKALTFKLSWREGSGFLHEVEQNVFPARLYGRHEVP